MAESLYIPIDAAVVPTAFERVVGKNVYSNRYTRYNQQMTRNQPDMASAVLFTGNYQGSLLPQAADKLAYTQGFSIYAESLNETARRQKLAAPKIGRHSLRNFTAVNTSFLSSDLLLSITQFSEQNLSDTDVEKIKETAQKESDSSGVMPHEYSEISAMLDETPFQDELESYVEQLRQEREGVNTHRARIFAVKETGFALACFESIQKRDPGYQNFGHFLLGAADSSLIYFGKQAVTV